MTDPQTAEAPQAPEKVEKKRELAWWKRHLAVPVGRMFAQTLAASWRFSEHNTGDFDRLRAEGKPFLLAVWHGQLFVAVMANRHRDFSAMASTHGDADLIARMMMRWGYIFVRGSSSKGGRAALLQMVEHLKDGRHFAITPDGPRGPRGVPKPGTLVAAVRSSAAIVTMHFEVSSAWRFKSWDRFCLPKPFSRVRAIYSDAWYPPDTSEESMTELTRRLGPVEALDWGRGAAAPQHERQS
jgi:lysophospholipid acyltransferase (LPLAT)-like uncharacterized protein